MGVPSTEADNGPVSIATPGSSENSITGVCVGITHLNSHLCRLWKKVRRCCLSVHVVVAHVVVCVWMIMIKDHHKRSLYRYNNNNNVNRVLLLLLCLWRDWRLIRFHLIRFHLACSHCVIWLLNHTQTSCLVRTLFGQILSNTVRHSVAFFSVVIFATITQKQPANMSDRTTTIRFISNLTLNFTYHSLVFSA